MDWTFIDENNEEEISEETCALLDEAAARIKGLRQTREERGFIAAAYLDEHGHLPGEDVDGHDDEEEALAAAARYKARREVQRTIEKAEEEALLALLYQHGARMMRPYEHWNEDERLMEYMERDR